MPPKKGSKKKGGNDDWEAELGESIAPAAGASPDVAAANGDHQDEEASQGGGGLMNLLKKRKEKRKNKGLDNDFVEGEDPTAVVDDDATAQYQPPDLSTKAPEEANLDDEFALPDKKGKKGKQAQAKAAPAAAAKDDEETGEGGRVLTKAEKEKLKKEREKQRKKEQVSERHCDDSSSHGSCEVANHLFSCRLQRRKPRSQHQQRPSPPNPLQRRRQPHRRRRPSPTLVARRRRSRLPSPPCRSNRRSCDADKKSKPAWRPRKRHDSRRRSARRPRS